MLTTKPIDASQLSFRYSGAGEHYEYDRETEKRSKEQTRHPATGFPLWKVRCVAVYRKGGEHGEITVTVPCAEIPAAEFDSEIMFSELTVKDWSMNGTQGQTWHAETFTSIAPTAPPSTSRPKKTETATAG